MSVAQFVDLKRTRRGKEPRNKVPILTQPIVAMPDAPHIRFNKIYGAECIHGLFAGVSCVNIRKLLRIKNYWEWFEIISKEKLNGKSINGHFPHNNLICSKLNLH